MSGYMYNGAFGFSARGATRWGEGSRRGNRGGCKTRQNQQSQNQIPEDLVDPCKVFVSNLRPRMTERTLHEALAHYADVERAIIIKDKHTKRSKGYGFVKVKTQEDVNKLLALSDSDRYIEGQQVIIRLAKKKISLPGDEGYVRVPLSDRDFDMSECDPGKPSIHMLVDDVIFKIFSYLPIRTLVRCEGVCRRWQLLVYRHFSKMTSLEINEESLGIPPPFTKAIISKLLILSGPNLKSLKVQRVDFATKQNILKIISQLCPMLEHLDVTKARGINFLHVSKLAQGCRNIKSFIAKNCIDFDEKALQQVLISFPQLERLDVAGTSVYGKNFNLLPSTLKELYIERIPDLCHKKKKITQIADNCPNLEVLEMKECMLSKKDLEYFGNNCYNLTKLSVYMPSVDATAAFATFKKLKDLMVVGESVDLTLLFSVVPQLESLTVDTDTVSEDVDFSVLKNLKCLKLHQTTINTESLLTLARCRQLKELHLYKCYSLPQDVLLGILKGCSELQRIACPCLQVQSAFITDVDHIMKDRHTKLVIEARSSSAVHDVHYDKDKIEFDFTNSFSYLYDPFGYDSADSDYSDVSFDGSWYDSDVDFPDHYLFEDHGFHDDLFQAAVMLAAWNVHDSDTN